MGNLSAGGAGEWPRRIVCLTAETPALLFRLGVGDRIVGVSNQAIEPPEVRSLPRIGGFASGDADRVASLAPDLVLAFSDLQAGIAGELIRRGIAVLATNQSTLAGTAEAMLLIGRVMGREAEALAFLEEWEAGWDEVRRGAAGWPRRPRVFFEEWPDPLVGGIGWVGELIEAAGGIDLAAGRRVYKAEGRVWDPAEVAERDPDVILASWCGRRFRPEVVRARPGWDRVAAVRRGDLYEIPPAEILQPGPLLLQGARRVQAILRAWALREEAGRGGAGPEGSGGRGSG